MCCPIRRLAGQRAGSTGRCTLLSHFIAHSHGSLCSLRPPSLKEARSAPFFCSLCSGRAHVGAGRACCRCGHARHAQRRLHAAHHRVHHPSGLLWCLWFLRSCVGPQASSISPLPLPSCCVQRTVCAQTNISLPLLSSCPHPSSPNVPASPLQPSIPCSPPPRSSSSSTCWCCCRREGA